MSEDLFREGTVAEETLHEATDLPAGHAATQETAETSSGDSGEGSATVIGQAGETIVVERPAPGQTVEIQAAAGQTYVLDFPPGDARIQVQGDNLILAFDDNGDGVSDSRVIFLDMVILADSSGAPVLQVAGVDIGSDVLIAQALALAGTDEIPFDTAAGPVGGGVSVYSDDVGQPIELLDAEGVIPPTELQFGLVDLEDEITLLDVEGAGAPPLADTVLTAGERGDPPQALLDAMAAAGIGTPPPSVQFVSVAEADGGEGGNEEFEILLFKQLTVDGDVGDDDFGEVADFGGSDVETPLESLVFTLVSSPAFGDLILVTAGGDTSLLQPGDTFTNADTVWWVTTQTNLDAFIESQGLDFIPPAEFTYSVTDESGASATESVTIGLPPLEPPSAVIEPVCLEEDTAGTISFSASPGDEFGKITQIVIAGFPAGGPADAWVVDETSVDIFGYSAGTDYTASYDAAAGELTITFVTAGFPLGEAVSGSVMVTPNPDSDVDIDLTITATSFNGSESATATAQGDIDVDANADGGEGSLGDDGDGVHLSIAASIVDSTGEEPENGTFQSGETGTLNIVATFDDFTDGSETHSIQVFAPAGFTILDPEGLPSGVTLVGNDGSIAVFDIETTNGVGSVDFDLPVTYVGATEGEADFLIRALAEETNTPGLIEGDVECFDGGEGGLSPVAGDNVAFVETTVTPAVADVVPPEVTLSLYGGADCIEEDSSLASIDNEVTVTVTPDGDDLLTGIVLSGFQPDWAYNFDGLDTDGPGGTDVVVTDNGDGTVSIAFANPANAPYNGSFSVQPPADSDVDHPTVTATAAVVDSIDNTLTDTGEGTLDIIVDAVVDGSEVEQTLPAEGDENTEIPLNLQIDLGGDSTTGPGESQGGMDKDGSESVTRLVVMLSLGTLGWVLPASVAAPEENPDGTWTFDTSGAALAEVQSLISSLSVTPPPDSAEDITVTVTTTTAEAAAVAGSNGASGEECDDGDNLDVDSYEFTVSVNPIAVPFLIVGENVADNDAQTTQHREHFPDATEEFGEIVGDDAGDFLSGDAGGGVLTGKTMNLVLVLDTSGSMEANILFNDVAMRRIEALDQAIEDLLDQLVATPGLTVRLHMISFSTEVKEVGTFDIISSGVVDEGQLQAAKNFILAAGDDPLTVAEGTTNYEAGFQAALDWFSDDGNTLDSPDFNKTIFVSDGLPNQAYSGDDTTTVIGTPTVQVALNHVLGQQPVLGVFPADTVSEFAGLLGAFEGVNGTVDAVGIAVGAAGVTLLTQIDSDAADNITHGEELAEVLGDLSGVTQLEAAGNDVIIGNGGADVIFGDVLYTDLLAADVGISLPAGSGWEVIQQMVTNGDFDDDASLTVEEEILAFLRNPANIAPYQFGRESEDSEGEGREGGNDLIDGGAGDDLIFGQEGNDTIDGGAGADIIIGGTGDDSLTGGDGPDLFVSSDQFNVGEVDTITDFDDDPGGDTLDVSALLQGYTAGDDLTDYLSVSYDGSDTTIAIDAAGDGGGTDVTIVCEDVDLTGGVVDQATIISNMIDDNQLAVA